MVGVLKTSNRSKGAGQLMIAIVLIAMAAGSASALMFASTASGALISLVLLYFAPLPLMMAALAWGPLCATIGGIAAAAGLGLIFGLPHCVAFALTIALPAWRLGHLALLGRPLVSSAPAADDAGAIDWYPVGRILLWIVAFSTVMTMAALLTLGFDGVAIGEMIRSGLASMLEGTGVEPSDPRINALATIAPAASAIGAMIMLTLNFWLAAKITATSGRLPRPWPDLKSVDLPPITLAALSIAVAFCFTDGLPAMLALAITAALMLAYAFIGLAVLHTVTLALKSRLLWLSCIYTIVVVFSWTLLGMVVLGLADSLFGFRRRYLLGRPPPIPAP
jgi:magnesium-transporting ATPase (P-type)